MALVQIRLSGATVLPDDERSARAIGAYRRCRPIRGVGADGDAVARPRELPGRGDTLSIDVARTPASIVLPGDDRTSGAVAAECDVILRAGGTADQHAV